MADETLEQLAIKPGDVLLFRGGGFIAWAIRALDGTDVNHAAIALDQQTMGEAAGRGLQRTPIADALQSNGYMRVRRHTHDDLGPVVRTANDYLSLGTPYAYQQLVLLALLASTRKIPMTGVAKRLIRSILDHAAAALNAFVDKDGRRSMICSEFVYRAYREAISTPPEIYRLLVQVGAVAFDPMSTSLAEWAVQQPDDLYEAAIAAPASFDTRNHISSERADLMAEVDLAPLVTAWAAENEMLEEDMDLPAAATGTMTAAPEDDELLGSLVDFATSFTRATSVGPESFGIGLTVGLPVARGAIQGLLRVEAEPNFVTPGDLAMSPSLTDIGATHSDR
jgi:hypothetical protein